MWRSPIAGAKWVRTWRLGEWLSGPVSPLFETLVVPLLARAREAGGTKHLGWRLPRGWHLREPWFCVLNGYFFARADFSLLSFARFLLADVPRIEGALARWRETSLPRYLKRLERQRAFDPQEASVPALLGHIEDLCWDAAAWWHLVSLDSGGASFMERVLRVAYRWLIVDGPPVEAFLRGMDTPQLAGERRLHALARRVAGAPELLAAFARESPERILTELATARGGPAFRSDLEGYLEAYGHQVTSLDFLHATPREDATLAVSLLRKILADGIPDPALRVATAVAERERAERDLAERLARSPLRRRILQKLIERCRLLAVRREVTVFGFQQGWPVLRRAVLEAGRRLASSGTLAEAADVFFLTRDELWGALLRSEGAADPASLAARARDRMAQWERQRTLSPPDRIPAASDPIWKVRRGPLPWGDGRHDTTEPRPRLIGEPASFGVARGPARIVRSPADFARFRKGDVLVAVATLPAWTSLFGLAAAVVTESGGVTCHASIVAREFGIPAVIATGCATTALEDGQTVEVDGSRGVVYL